MCAARASASRKFGRTGRALDAGRSQAPFATDLQATCVLRSDLEDLFDPDRHGGVVRPDGHRVTVFDAARSRRFGYAGLLRGGGTPPRSQWMFSAISCSGLVARWPAVSSTLTTQPGTFGASYSPGAGGPSSSGGR